MEQDPIQQAIEEAQGLVDTYHAMSHPAELAQLWEVRRNMVAAMMRCARMVRPAYGNKALKYVYVKYNIAREITDAIGKDKKEVGTKPRAFNQIETQTQALDGVVRAKEEQVRAEAQHEELEAVMKAVDKALYAMGQEIKDGMAERSYQNHLEALRIKDEYETKRRTQ